MLVYEAAIILDTIEHSVNGNVCLEASRKLETISIQNHTEAWTPQVLLVSS